MTEGLNHKVFELLPEHRDDPDEFVNFGEVSRYYLEKQTQYGSRYINGSVEGYPNLGEGLSFQGDPADYHTLEIRKGDIPVFLSRFLEYRKQVCG